MTCSKACLQKCVFYKICDTADIVDIAMFGRLEILADPAQESTKEARTFTEIFLGRLQELAKELANNPYKTIQLQDQIYSAQNLKELNELIETYEARQFNEEQAELNKQGQDTSYDIVCKFNEL